MPLNILNIVQSARQGIVDINDDHLPISFTLIQQCHDTEHLDLLDLADFTDPFADFADVEGVVVAVGFGFRVGDRGVFPGLGEGSVVPDLREVQASVTNRFSKEFATHVTVVGETVSDESQLALLDVYLDISSRRSI